MLLYHATLNDHRDSILSEGLVPRVGKFTQAVHGHPHPVVCLAKSEDVPNTFAALVFHVVDKFIPGAFFEGKHDDVLLDFAERRFTFRGVEFSEWIERIKTHGLLCEVETDACLFHDGGDGHPMGAEPGDYYSTAPLPVKRVLAGTELWQFYLGSGLNPAPWPFSRHFDIVYVKKRYA